MKFLKKLATICLALMMCLGLGAVFTACDDESSNGSGQTVTATYTFQVLKQDNTPAIGYKLQLCTTDGVSCLLPVEVSADGTLSYSITDASVAYEIHVMKGDETLENAHTTTTAALVNNGGHIPANYSGDTIVIIITK